MSTKMKRVWIFTLVASILIMCTGSVLMISSQTFSSGKELPGVSGQVSTPVVSEGSVGSDATELLGDETDDVAHEIGQSYYVDAVNGSDDNDGMTPETAFLTLAKANSLMLEPGDRILLKRDCEWNGALRPQGSGTKETPIVIGMYGTGSKRPLINGNGEVRAAVDIVNVDYIAIRNLEVTNYGDDEDYRTGISVVGRDTIAKGISVVNCYVHDVNSTDTRTSSMDPHWFGGIIVKGEYYTSKTAGVEEVLLDSNIVKNVNPSAIVVHGGEQAKGVVIRNNFTDTIGGDGIIMVGTRGGLIEKNTSKDCGQNGTGNPYVGIWTMSSSDAILQYNESYGNDATADGQGFDVDNSCNNVIVQYNYSHDNYGGFILFNCLFGYSNTIVRYNISQNDGRAVFAYYLDGTTKGLLSEVYNNTIYTSQSLESVIVTTNYTPAMGNIGTYRNNIFYIQNSNSSTQYNIVEGNLTFENNCFFGDEVRHEPEDAKKVSKNPMLVGIGTGKVGMTTLDGYKLRAGSSCLGTGTVVSDNGGKDFWGNAVSATEAPNIGAYNGPAAEIPEAANIAAFKPVTASSLQISKFENAFVYAKQATDEDVFTKLSTQLKDGQAQEWIEVDLLADHQISKIHLVSTGQYFPIDYSVSVYTGQNWVEVASASRADQPADGQAVSFEFDAIQGSKIRIEAKKLREADKKFGMELAEIQVYQTK